ncbi:MAG: hypothetical protein H6634_13405 [Anaerolineales bacterium]|nr:hypothetical protein [Anaerolineales bacterium]
MPDSEQGEQPASITKNLALVLGLPWIEIIAEAWKFGRKVLRGLTDEGVYEVIEYDSTLELHDSHGKEATFTKRKKIRYLQNDIIAYQDYGWGDGEQFVDYQAKPGVPVDRYKIGYKTYILISLRDVKNRGDTDEFNIQWKIKNGFLKPDGFWETDVSSRTRRLRMSVVFPKGRPPRNVRLVENNIRKTTNLGSDTVQRTANGHWKITWEKYKPRLFEHYIIRWDW